MRSTILALLAVSAGAQNPVGGLNGIVSDALTHQPVKKAMITFFPVQPPAGQHKFRTFFSSIGCRPDPSTSTIFRPATINSRFSIRTTSNGGPTESDRQRGRGRPVRSKWKSFHWRCCPGRILDEERRSFERLLRTGPSS